MFDTRNVRKIRGEISKLVHLNSIICDCNIPFQIFYADSEVYEKLQHITPGPRDVTAEAEVQQCTGDASDSPPHRVTGQPI